MNKFTQTLGGAAAILAVSAATFAVAGAPTLPAHADSTRVNMVATDGMIVNGHTVQNFACSNDKAVFWRIPDGGTYTLTYWAGEHKLKQMTGMKITDAVNTYFIMKKERVNPSITYEGNAGPLVQQDVTNHAVFAVTCNK